MIRFDFRFFINFFLSKEKRLITFVINFLRNPKKKSIHLFAESSNFQNDDLYHDMFYVMVFLMLCCCNVIVNQMLFLMLCMIWIQVMVITSDCFFNKQSVTSL